MYRRTVLKSIMAALAAPSAFAAGGSGYPSKAVKIIVGYPPGGNIGAAARVIAHGLSKASGQSFYVENLGGAGGTIAATRVARSEPDGYTLFLSNSAMPLSQAIYPKLEFDSVSSFRHVATFSGYASIIVCRPSLAVSNMKELIAMAKARPGKLTFASSGYGTLPHLTLEILKERAGIDMVHVPYKGTAPSVTDLLSGSVDLLATGLPSLYPYVKAGTMRALAVTTRERSTYLPNVEALSETLPNIDLNVWLGLSGPAGMPAQVASELAALIKRAAADPEVTGSLEKALFATGTIAGAEFEKLVSDDLKLYRSIVQSANIKADL